MTFGHRHLLGIEPLSPTDITAILDLADQYVAQNRRAQKHSDTLAGLTQINMFFENSTRTQASFELAGKRLGADVMNMSMQTSSVKKGETLIDTALTLNAMHPDLLVVRHPQSGAVALLAQKVNCAVLNAGDGKHEHPTQALLDAPMFEVRWRWNASTALAVLRRWTSKKVPPAVQRIHSEDLIAQVFPDQIACLENVVGEREIPDHPLVNQTIYDCLYEAMDIENLENLLVDINAGEIELNTRDLTEPSPLSQQILNARPYAFLDDVPLEERRTHAVQNRRWLDPSEAAELGQLDPEAIKIVKDEAWPEAENADDLHDALVLCGFLTLKEAEDNRWMPFFNELISENRATLLKIEQKEYLVAVERLIQMLSIYKDAILNPEIEIPGRLKEGILAKEEALVEIVRSRLEALGPVTVNTIFLTLGVSPSEVDQALIKLEGEGFVFRGNFTPGLEELEWCERRLLARINKYTLTKLRREIEPVSASDFMRFLFSWQGVSSDEQAEGVEALKKVLDQLEGFEAPAASWEGDIFSTRLKNYDHTWMDTLCLSGSAVWGRFRIANTNGSKKSSPIKTTPITIIKRSNLDIWKNIGKATENNLEDLSHNAKKVFEFISSKGASFFEEIISGSKCLRTETEIALAELVAKGLITSDSYTGLRALLVRSKYKTEKGRRKKRISFNMEGAGRWSLINKTEQQEEENKNLSEEMRALARIFLNRYGVVFRKLLERESFAPPWRDLVRALRLLELRGEVRGGRFVEGVTGEQFALPEAVASLRDTRRKKQTGDLVSLSASDPLNLMGIITPGKKVASHYKNRVLYRDGAPAAFKEGDQIRLLSEFDNDEEWSIKQKLVKRNFSPKLKPYLGKGAA